MGRKKIVIWFCLVAGCVPCFWFHVLPNWVSFSCKERPSWFCEWGGTCANADRTRTQDCNQCSGTTRNWTWPDVGRSSKVHFIHFNCAEYTCRTVKNWRADRYWNNIVTDFHKFSFFAQQRAALLWVDKRLEMEKLHARFVRTSPRERCCFHFMSGFPENGNVKKPGKLLNKKCSCSQGKIGKIPLLPFAWDQGKRAGLKTCKIKMTFLAILSDLRLWFSGLRISVNKYVWKSLEN